MQTPRGEGQRVGANSLPADSVLSPLLPNRPDESGSTCLKVFQGLSKLIRKGLRMVPST